MMVSDSLNPAQAVALSQPVTVDGLLDALRNLIDPPSGERSSDSVRLAIVVGRQRGARLFRRWVAGRDGWAVVRRAVEAGLASAAKAERYPDAFQIDIGFAPARGSVAALKALGRSQVGRKGLALLQGTRLLAAAGPSEMIAANRNFERALAWLLERQKLPPDAAETGTVAPALFDAVQILVRLGPPARADLLWRGNRVVMPDEIDADGVRKLAEGMCAWMRHQVDGDGRIVYKYFPSSGRESGGDNSIRQAMATVCLNRIALFTGAAADREIADRNLVHLLRKYFRRDGALGYIAEGEKAKLGAAALAALAIHENPAAADHAEPLAALSATVDALWQSNGAFRTFLKPADRNDNQNFYPGEALLFWAARLARVGPRADAARFLQSFAFYREHFRAARNPAFVPWHTQAYFAALPAAGAAAGALKDFVFEMNDWLLPMQQWDRAPQPDLRGRFYDPEHPEYGPPHASSTGVYLEGLIDAFGLARQEGDRRREQAYRLAILRGLRSLMQLQFRDDIDMYYVSQRERVFGGIRTEAYDNAIRVDNVQHGLMALLKILARLSPGELSLGPA
jgi:hypothetical protein